MKPSSPITKTLPLKMVGSAVFGRYPKISVENTFNMIISDDWMVPFAGYKIIQSINSNGEGRAIHVSTKSNSLFVVVDSFLYKFDSSLNKTLISSLSTSTGDVFIAENNAGQIEICDKQNLYNYNYNTAVFTILTTATLGFTPLYVEYQDTYFIVAGNDGNWHLSAQSDGTSFPNDSQHVGAFQTKADIPVAVLRMPGKGNTILIFGSNVTERWSDLGLELFPYQRDTFNNIDYGCLSSATIAALDNFVVWLAGNEQAGPTIMYSDGSAVKRLSTDGIGFLLSSFKNPANSYGFLFRQDDHLIYVLTFVEDNYSICHDFNTGKFFTLTDENQGFFIAKKVAYFNHTYYFVSIIDGNLYELNSKYTSYNGQTIPRIRVCPTYRNNDSSRFVIQNVNFVIEQGSDENIQSVDFCMSKNGGVTFGNFSRKILNPLGFRKNRFRIWNLGSANEFTPQFRFNSTDRFVFSDGEVNIYQ